MDNRARKPLPPPPSSVRLLRSYASSSSFPPCFPLFILFALSLISVNAGSYESTKLLEQEGAINRLSPYALYQPWSYMKRTPAAPIIRFGKRSRSSAERVDRELRTPPINPLIRFGKRSASALTGPVMIRFGRRAAERAAPLIRFGKRGGQQVATSPLIRFGRSWTDNE